METSEELAREILRAAGELDSLLAGISEPQAGIRCAADSRTVAAIANHVVAWLCLVADSAPELKRDFFWPPNDEVAEEIDAEFAKASANRTLIETRRRLISSSQRLASMAIEIDDLRAPVAMTVPTVAVGSLLEHWAYDHVLAHASEIRAALLAADRATNG